MALSQQTLDLLAQLDAATTGIATRLQTIANAHPDDAALQAALAPEIAKLQGLAADPSNPVPATP